MNTKGPILTLMRRNRYKLQEESHILHTHICTHIFEFESTVIEIMNFVSSHSMYNPNSGFVEIEKILNAETIKTAFLARFPSPLPGYGLVSIREALFLR